MVYQSEDVEADADACRKHTKMMGAKQEAWSHINKGNLISSVLINEALDVALSVQKKELKQKIMNAVFDLIPRYEEEDGDLSWLGYEVEKACEEVFGDDI